MVSIKNYNRNNGSTLVIVLIMSAILFILGMSLLSIIGIEASTMISNENTAKVLYTADSGMMWIKSEIYSRRFYNITLNNTGIYFVNSPDLPGVDSFSVDSGYNLPSALASALEVQVDTGAASGVVLSFKVLRDTNYRATDGTIHPMSDLINPVANTGYYFLYRNSDPNDPYIAYYNTAGGNGPTNPDVDHSLDYQNNTISSYAQFFPDGVRDSSGNVITAPPKVDPGVVDYWRRWPHNCSANPADTTNPSDPHNFDNSTTAAVFSATENRCPVAGCTHNNDKDAGGKTLVHFHYLYYFTVVAFKYNPGQTYDKAATKKIIKVQIASVDRLDLCEYSPRDLSSQGKGTGNIQYLVDRRNIIYKWFEQNR